MEQRLSMITLAVADLAHSVGFYEEVLGWRMAESPPGIAFFDLGGIVFALYPREAFAEDIGIGSGAVRGINAALAHNVASTAEVDAIFARLGAEGATILKPPQTAFWGGYSGYFADPDGYPWEVAYNPFWQIADDGRIVLGAEPG